MPDELAAAFKAVKYVSSLAVGEIRWNENSYRRILVAANKPVRAEYDSRGWNGMCRVSGLGLVYAPQPGVICGIFHIHAITTV